MVIIVLQGFQRVQGIHLAKSPDPRQDEIDDLRNPRTLASRSKSLEI